MISVNVNTDFSKLDKFMKTLEDGVVSNSLLEKYGELGVKALANATPKDTGLAASSWYYTITRTKNKIRLVWCNSDIEDGNSVAVLLQYGHATKDGYFIEGIDYINPALAPVMAGLMQELNSEVKRL